MHSEYNHHNTGIELGCFVFESKKWGTYHLAKLAVVIDVGGLFVFVFEVRLVNVMS